MKRRAQSISEEYFAKFPRKDNLNFDTEKDFLIKNEDFEQKEALGSSQNVVEKVKHIPSGKFAAIKTIHIPRSKRYGIDLKHLEKNLNEIHIMDILKGSSSIVQLYGWSISDKYLRIFMEVMDVSLEKLTFILRNLPNDYGFMQNVLFNAVFTDTLDGLIECRKKNICHGDLKSANILLTNGKAKLGDFGESYFIKEEHKFACYRANTPWCLPPEQFMLNFKNDIESKEKADVWSLGVIGLELYFGTNPLLFLSGTKSIAHISSLLDFMRSPSVYKELDGLLRQPGFYRDEIEIIAVCLKKFEERPLLKDLQDHEFLKAFNNVKEPINLLKQMMELLKEYDHNEIQNHKINQIKFLNSKDTYEFSLFDFEYVHRQLVFPEKETFLYYHKKTKNFMSLSEPYDYHHELLMLRKFQNHCSVISFYGLCNIGPRTYICTEVMNWSLQLLSEFINELEYEIPEKLLGHVSVVILDLLEYMNKLGYAHGNLEPTSVLIKHDGTVKITNFELTWNFEEQKEFEEIKILFEDETYVPPERIFEEDSLDARNDLWALGMVLIDAISGEQYYLKGSIIRRCGKKLNLCNKRLEEEDLELYEEKIPINIDDIPDNTHDCQERGLEFYGGIRHVVKDHLEDSNYSLPLYDFIKSCLQNLDERSTCDELTQSVFYKEHSKSMAESKGFIIQFFVNLSREFSCITKI